MAKRRFAFNKNVNINRVVSKVVMVILALYVGGTILTTFGQVMGNMSSPLFSGLSLIGWTVTDNVITHTGGSGVLAVVGIIGIASVVLEFVKLRY